MPCKAEEESGLAPADDENAAGRKISRKDIYFLMGEQYYSAFFPHPPQAAQRSFQSSAATFAHWAASGTHLSE